MSKLTRVGTAEPVWRDQFLRRERGQRMIHFSCSAADHEQDWQPCPVVRAIHTNIVLHTHTAVVTHIYVPRGLCAPRTLAAYVLPTTSYSCALSAFGARTASGINPYRIGRFSRGPVPNASKRQFGSANLGSPGPLYDKATQGCQSESCLGGWRCKDPSEEVDRRRRGWTAYKKISRPSARSRARAKDGSGSHSELLSRMDGTG